MSRVRSAAVSGLLVLSLLGLSACGSDDSGSGSGSGSGDGTLSSVTVEGEVGKEPKVTFDGALDGSKPETKVLTEGDGATVASGDTVSMNYWIGNGTKKKVAQSTYAQGPQTLALTSGVLAPLRNAIVGTTVGSRVAILAPATEIFGESGNAGLGFAAKDSVLLVVDVAAKVTVLDAPKGEEKTPASWAPTLVEKAGVITGLDFSGTRQPSGELLATTLVKGDGPVVKKGQTLQVRYLGQVYGGAKPFDENFSAATPASFPIGVGQVVAGWDERLVGRTVGSRLILEIPPAKGYGESGNPQAGIKGTDTLVFVVDILGAA